MKTIKHIATRILKFPVEETGVAPLMLLLVTIVALALMMRFCYC